jgi:hypothetical protein
MLTRANADRVDRVFRVTAVAGKIREKCTPGFVRVSP